MYIGLFIIILSLSICVILMYIKTSKILKQLNYMIDSVINNTFSQNNFNESKLSRLESKLYQYLLAGSENRRQLNYEKDIIKALVSDIAHQTKTPISNILLYTQLLIDLNELDDNAKKIAYNIENQTEKLSFLVESLVKASRLENGIVSVIPKKNNVNDLIEALKIQYIAYAKSKNIILVIEIPPNLSANFDFKWTLEVLSNILDNALKYTPSGGKIEITAQSYEMFIRIDIKDNGIGISENEITKIFSRFYRSQSVADENGVGIGLYLAREIISKQSGYIKVASILGQGSTFSVFLAR